MRAHACVHTHTHTGNEQEGLYNVPKDYRKWTHPAEAIEIKEKCERMECMIESTRMAAKLKME